jgi:hypothetical protein
MKPKSKYREMLLKAGERNLNLGHKGNKYSDKVIAKILSDAKKDCIKEIKDMYGFTGLQMVVIKSVIKHIKFPKEKK